MSASEDFYLRYYVGHKGKFGHEFLEFEFRPDGKLRYANNSNYKNDTMIRKEAYVHNSVMDELKRIIVDSEIMAEDDAAWPPPDRVGRQVSQRYGRFKLHASKRGRQTDMALGVPGCPGRPRDPHHTNHVFCLPGTRDCYRGRAHLLHDIQDRFTGGR